MIGFMFHPVSTQGSTSPLGKTYIVARARARATKHHGLLYAYLLLKYLHNCFLVNVLNEPYSACDKKYIDGNTGTCRSHGCADQSVEYNLHN